MKTCMELAKEIYRKINLHPHHADRDWIMKGVTSLIDEYTGEKDKENKELKAQVAELLEVLRYVGYGHVDTLDKERKARVALAKHTKGDK